MVSDEPNRLYVTKLQVDHLKYQLDMYNKEYDEAQRTSNHELAAYYAGKGQGIRECLEALNITLGAFCGNCGERTL